MLPVDDQPAQGSKSPCPAYPQHCRSLTVERPGCPQRTFSSALRLSAVEARFFILSGHNAEAGTALASLEWQQSGRETFTRLARKSAPLAWPALGVLIVLGTAMTWSHRGMFIAGFALAAISAAILVATSHAPGSFSHLLKSAPLVWIGRRSYAIYLRHYPILILCLIDLKMPLLWSGITCVTGALIAADLSYRFIEKPFLALRYRPMATLASTLSIAVSLAGVVTIPLALFAFFVARI